jgi:hypothetical protein
VEYRPIKRGGFEIRIACGSSIQSQGLKSTYLNSGFNGAVNPKPGSK